MGSGIGVYIGPRTDGGPGINYFDLFIRISRAIGHGDNPQQREIALNRQIIEDGYQQFLAPPPLPSDRGRKARDWSFLSPIRTLETEAGTHTYALPSDFGWMLHDRMIYGVGAGKTQVRQRNESEVRQRHADSSGTSGPPQVFAVRPRHTTQTRGTAWEIILWPTPADTYYLGYVSRLQPASLGLPLASGPATMAQVSAETAYRSVVDASANFLLEALTQYDRVIITGTNANEDGIYTLEQVVETDAGPPAVSTTVYIVETDITSNYSVSYEILPQFVYALGGQSHSQTLIASCMEVMERTRDDAQGIHAAKWAERLAASRNIDLHTAPLTLGGDTTRTRRELSRVIGETGYDTGS